MSDIDPEVQTLAGPPLSKSLVFLTGSHMYGLDTPESDRDYTVLYWDAADDRRVFPYHPDSLQSSGNDHKLYSLRHFAVQVAKGNPNSAELFNLLPELTPSATREQAEVSRFLVEIRPYLVTQRLAGAYMGHLDRLTKEIRKGDLRAKRLSHGFRLLACLEQLLITRDVPDFRQLPKRQEALDIKTGRSSTELAMAEFPLELKRVNEVYRQVRPNLPDGLSLRSAINRFFVAQD